MNLKQSIPIFLFFLFWVLHTYSVRRARYLVRLELGSLPDQPAEDKQTVDGRSARSLSKTAVVPPGNRAAVVLTAEAANSKEEDEVPITPESTRLAV
jgi:hypothetical protein